MSKTAKPMSKTIVTEKSEITYYKDKIVIQGKSAWGRQQPVTPIAPRQTNRTHGSAPPPPAPSAQPPDARVLLRQQLGLDTIGQRTKK